MARERSLDFVGRISQDFVQGLCKDFVDKDFVDSHQLLTTNFTQVPIPETLLPKLSYLPLISPTCPVISPTRPLISPNRSARGTGLHPSVETAKKVLEHTDVIVKGEILIKGQHQINAA